ncbi:hypothetical protein RCL1_004072 [Eukaryota sp. TZLM3-RCL]
MAARLNTLTKQPINLVAYRDAARKELLDILRSFHGPKALVIDPELIGPVKQIVLQEDLRNAGVSAFFTLTTRLPNTAPPCLVFIARPTPQNVNNICESKLSAGDVVANSSTRRVFRVLFTPRVTQVCTRLFEQRNMLTSIKLSSFELLFIPLDDDIISLERTNCLRRIFIDGDTSAIFHAAQSIVSIEQRHGIIVKIVALGRQAMVCAEAVKQLKANADVKLRPISPEIERLIIFDRTFDPITPMCTQLTYEGLLDEIIGINCGSISLSCIHGKEVVKQLNSGDVCFSEFRDLNFAASLTAIHQRASALNSAKEELERMKSNPNTKIEDIKEFWDNVNSSLRSYKELLPDHLGLAEYLVNHSSSTVQGRLFHRKWDMEQDVMGEGREDSFVEFLEELIGRGEKIDIVLRLLCLYTLLRGGLKKSTLENIKREILLEYGFHHLFTLNNLENIGFLKPYPHKNFWNQLKTKLKLINDDPNESNPTDMDFVYSGYCPLSCRLIQRVVNNMVARKPTFEGIEEFLTKLGQFSEFSQELLPGTPISEEPSTPLNFVFFVGGVTCAEVSALRWMSQKGLGQVNRLLVGTTHVVTGKRLVDSLVEAVPGLD